MTQMRPSWIVIALLLAGCRREPDDKPAPPAPPPTPSTTPAPAALDTAPGCRLADNPWRRQATGRIVAVGDLHGDLTATRAALRVAGVIDPHDRWIGGTTTLVQTGDVLDRGGDEQAIIDLLERLEGEAAAAGGAVIWLLGNHELMNAAADFRYVTHAGFTDFADVPGLDTAGLVDVPELARARVAALRPGGPYAQILAGQNTIAIVGDTVFAHGGLVEGWTDNVDAVNRDDRCWLAGGGDLPAAAEAQDGPVWTRAYGMPDVDCAAAAAVLRELGVARMVVGHTVQIGGITSACDGTVWRIDVGLAAIYGGPIEVLELAPGAGPQVLHGERP